MILHPFSEVPLCSFARLRDNALWLEAFLSRIPITPSSALAAHLDVLKALPEGRTEATPRDISGAIGIAFLASALQAAEKHHSFAGLGRLVNHLAKDAEISPTAAGPSSDPRNLVFELEMGACLIAGNIPAESRSEPDLVCQHGGSTWALSLKNVYSPQLNTLVDRVQDACGQALRLEDANALVVAGLSNRIDHATFLPLLDSANDIWGSFPNAAAAIGALKGSIDSARAAICSELRIRDLGLATITRFRGVVLVAQAACGIEGKGTLLSGVAFLDRRDLFEALPIEGGESDLVERLHRVTQSLLSS
jgi:hypothetical protein